MASVTVTGILQCTDGTVIPLEATLAEGTESNLTTNTTYTVSASEAGDFAPGKTVTSSMIQGTNGIGYAYILRQGIIACLLNVSNKGIAGAGPMPNCHAFTLQPGDVVRVMANTASSRLAAMGVYTNRGVSRIFHATPAGAATTELVDLQTGNSIGNTLQGQIIVKSLCTSVDGNKINGGGVLVLNEKGIPVGVTPANATNQSAPLYSNVSIPIALNYVTSLVTSS